MSFFRELAEYKDFDFWQFWEQVKISEVKTVLSKKKLMKNDYLITEKPLKSLLIFSLPMIIGNLFQQFYTMADSAIVGRFVGEQALAAVGASYALTNIFICVAIVLHVVFFGVLAK